MTNLGAAILEGCSRQRGAPAIVGPRETLSYGELAALAASTADRLRLARIEPDEPVLIAVSNQPGDLAGFCGIWLAGGVAIPVHRTTVEAMAATLRERTGARLLVNMDPTLASPPTLTAETTVSVRGAPPEPRPLLENAAFVLFTSGSTGEPKGVVLSHERFAQKLAMIDAQLRFKEGERNLLPLQLTFVFGQWVSLLTLVRGGRIELFEKFDPVAVMNRLATGTITRLALVPTMLRALLPAAETHGAGGFRGQMMAGGEPLPAALGRRYRMLWPEAALGDIYGLTETGSCDFFLAPAEYDEGAGTIGRAGPDIDYRLAGDGELQVRSPTVMLGYLDQTRATAAAFEDGWFRTGDLVRERPDGRIELIGRGKDLVIRAGNKVSPLELERVFAEHPAVAGVLAAGAPDGARGEAIHLLVVPREGATVDRQQLIDWARERLDRYKLPDHVHLATELPLGRSGKADRGSLRKLIENGKL